MRIGKLWVPAAVLVGLLGAAPARGAIVDRVVAVVGERPLFWTDLLRRATAMRVQIRTQTRDPNVVSLQEQEMYRELLAQMIDDRLIEQQADKAHVTVTPGEIDRAIESIASHAQVQGHPVTVAQVLDEVERRGLGVDDFRDEMRRQILEGKLVELRVRPRVRVTESDARATYGRWVRELEAQSPAPRHVPAFADVRDEMMQRTMVEGLETGRKQWLAELRQHAYIDVRL